jgi:XTP/dITP diphosphohydrolase
VSEPARRPRLVLATSNRGKVREIRELLSGTGWDAVTVADLGIPAPTVLETGRSYLENAVAKAVAYASATGLPALADDSGLEVDALDGRPGPLSARYGGPAADDAARCARLLAELEGVPPARRGARFRCTIALARPGNAAAVREGTLEGRIADATRGESGFGYDPVFELPDGRTVAEIGAEKQQLSHRARALRAIAEVLGRELR